VNIPDRLRQFIQYPLLTLAGGTVTPGSVFVGLAVVLGSMALASVLSRSIRRILEGRGLETGAQFAVAKIARYTVITIGVLIAFGSMGLKLDALLAASTVVAVGIGFGLQNVAQNFISGLILLVEQPVRKGDFVKVGGTFGVVEDIGLRATEIVTRDEVTIIVPNSALITEPVVNHSRPTTNLRIRVAVSVAYGSDARQVERVLLDVAAKEKRVLREPRSEIRFEGFGESGMDFALLAWIAHPRDDLRIGSELRFAIEAAFRAAEITIPFPRRDVRIVGGEEGATASTAPRVG
jgi:small-conductance mechanosensitive channel